MELIGESVTEGKSSLQIVREKKITGMKINFTHQKKEANHKQTNKQIRKQ